MQRALRSEVQQALRRARRPACAGGDQDGPELVAWDVDEGVEGDGLALLVLEPMGAV